MTPHDDGPPILEPLLGIVFDLDGTLIVSRHDFGRMRSEIIHAAERYGVAPGSLSAEEPVYRILEAARTEIRSVAAADGPVFKFDAEVTRLIDHVEFEALPRTTARPGAEILLRGLAQRGFRLGVLTRSSEAFCRAALDQTQLAPYFPYLRTRSTPGPQKPSPEALRLLLSEMGVPVERALFVGDHVIDAECAVHAGVRFYGVLPDSAESSTMTADRLLAAGAKSVADNLSDLARHLSAATAFGLVAA